MKNIFAGILCLLLACIILYSFNAKVTFSNLKAIQMTQENTAPQYLYKVISVEAWEESHQKNQVMNSSLDDKFIHLATEAQLTHIVEKFWNGKRHIILKLDPKKLEGMLVYEANPGGTNQYYHLYDGIIPLTAVVEITS